MSGKLKENSKKPPTRKRPASPSNLRRSTRSSAIAFNQSLSSYRSDVRDHEELHSIGGDGDSDRHVGDLTPVDVAVEDNSVGGRNTTEVHVEKGGDSDRHIGDLTPVDSVLQDDFDGGSITEGHVESPTLKGSQDDGDLSLSSGGMGFSDGPSLNITYDTASSNTNSGNVFTQFTMDSSISSTLSKVSDGVSVEKSASTIRSYTNVDTGENYMRLHTPTYLIPLSSRNFKALSFQEWPESVATRLKFRDTIGDGGCLFYSFIDCLIDLNVHSKINALNNLETRASTSGLYKGMLAFRRMVRDFLVTNFDALHDRSLHFFVDEFERPFRVFDDSLDPKDPTNKRNWNNEMVSHSAYLVSVCYEHSYYDSHPPTKLQHRHFWGDATRFVPLVCLMFGVSLYYYTIDKHDKRYTQLYSYRSDGRVQRFNRREGWLPPHKGSTGLFWNGTNHFESLCLESVTTFGPAPIATTKPKVERPIETLGNSVDLNTPERPATPAADTTETEPKRKDPPELLIAAFNASKVKMTNDGASEETKSSESVEKLPAVERKKDVADKFPQDSAGEGDKDISSNRLELHPFHIPSPVRDAVANRPPKIINPYFVREEVRDGIPLVHLRSEGKFELEINVSDFSKLISVKPGIAAEADEDPVQFLSWVEHDDRTMRMSIIEKCLRENHPIFASHYLVRNRQQPKVGARFDETKVGKKRRVARLNDFAVWIVGQCAHNTRGTKGYCSSTCIVGFTEDDIRHHFISRSHRIRIHGEIYGDCCHVKNSCMNIVRGVDKETIINQHGRTRSNKAIRMNPGELYDLYHAGRAAENHGFAMRSRKVAFNLSTRTNTKNLMVANGLTKKDTLANVYEATQYSQDDDAAMRKEQRELFGNSSKLVRSNCHLGVVKEHGYRQQVGNSGTTPFSVILCSARSIQIFNCAAMFGTAVIHIDGTKCRVPWGAHVKPGFTPQLWQAVLSASFVQRSHSNKDPNRFIRKNFSPRLISEFHTSLTASEDIARWLKTIFDMQYDICKTYERPLVVKTDCAHGLTAGIFRAFAIDGRIVITRILYNNLMLVVLCYASTKKWEETTVDHVLSMCKLMVPVFHSICRPHVIRAVRSKLVDKSLPKEVKDMSDYLLVLVLTLFRHATSTISLTETIVHMGLVLYLLETESLTARSKYISRVPEAFSIQPTFDEIGVQVKAFVDSQVTQINDTMAKRYTDLAVSGSLNTIEAKRYVLVDLVDTVIQSARVLNLPMTFSYCTKISGKYHYISTAYCYGVYPRLLKDNEKPTEELYHSPREPKTSISHAQSTILSETIDGSCNSDAIVIANPFHLPEISKYLRDEWVKILPSISCDIPRLCRVAISVEVDNSNNLNEQQFGMIKHDPVRKEYEKDAGLYIRRYWEQDKVKNSLWINDLEQINVRVDEFNRRRENREQSEPVTTLSDSQLDELNERQSIPWGESVNKYTRCANDLRQHFANNPVRCGTSKARQYNTLKSFFESHAPVVPMIKERTFKRWIYDHNESPVISDEQLERVKHFITERDVIVQEDDGSIHSSNTVHVSNVALPSRYGPSTVTFHGEAVSDIPQIGLHSQPTIANPNTSSGSNVDVRPVMVQHVLDTHLSDTANEYRLLWDVFERPRKLPKRCSEEIDEHIKQCVEDAGYAKKWASHSETKVTNMVLTDNELEGDQIESDDDDDTVAEVVQPRMFLGINVPEGVESNSRWSVLLKPRCNEHVLLERLKESLPSSLFPTEDDTVESVLRKNNNNPWLDDVRRYGVSECLNGYPSNRTPLRRTNSIIEKESEVIGDPVDATEVGRECIRMYVYTCNEMAPQYWMCRPATNEEHAAVMIIWRAAWPYLSRPSRQRPPNAWQYCVYQHILGHAMGPHRDNFDVNSLRALDRGDSPAKPTAKRCGINNSQLHGTCVIVYSLGNMPMRMVFHTKRATGRGLEKDDYEVSDFFSFEFGPGYISILDCIDDCTMMHGMDYVGVKLKGDPKTLVRVGMVIRDLTTVEQFYKDCSRLRVFGKNRKLKDVREDNITGVTRHAGT